MAEQGTTVSQKIDGRRARGMRTREAIVSALLELVADGDISPTAQRIAGRAGVSVRSVYQHFTDVEGLHADAAKRMLEWVQATSGDIDLTWPRERRLDEFAAGRADALEMLRPFMRAARVLEASSATVREHRLAMQRWEAQRVATVFAPELDRLDDAARAFLVAALDTMSSAEAWEHLRSGGHTVKSARLVTRAALAALLTSVLR